MSKQNHHLIKMEARIQCSYLGRQIPLDWVPVARARDGITWRHLFNGLSVIESAATEQDRRRWLHVSVARRDRLPTWDELTLVKSLWIGDDQDAFQVLPRASNYVNIHPYCLHLWHCLDRNPLPDFTRGGQSI